MSAPRDQRLFVDDMRAACASLAGILVEGEQAFLANERTRLAAERLIEILGEAATQIDEKLRSAHPEVPWRALIATRNRIIHGYHTVDPARVWATISQGIPTLQTQLDTVLSTLEDSP